MSDEEKSSRVITKKDISVVTLWTILGFIVFIVGATVTVDSRYATEEEVDEKIISVADKITLMESRLIAKINTVNYLVLEREIDDLKAITKERPLTSIEQRRLNRLERELEALALEWATPSEQTTFNLTEFIRR